MSSKTKHAGELFNPFPGLRPFTQDESHLFFGREGQSKSVLDSLEANRFVAVIGASGSGKSSLIYCGVIPELKERSEKSWFAVSTRPGTSPVMNMVSALSEFFPGQIGEEDAGKLLSGDLNIRKCLDKVLEKDQSLLLVIDQFEEIFRFKEIGTQDENIREVERFVDLIHEACSSDNTQISIVITMRSDFIGECSVFQDLTSLINKSNYLIPQMTREDYRKAIEGPVNIGGASIDKDLVEQLLDEVGVNTDQLPVLQHSLMRTWDYWKLQDDISKPITIGDYEAIGRMEKALSDHANEAFDELSESQRLICEYLFKTLTEKGGDNRGVRRPTMLKRVAEISRCSVEELISIADIFRSNGRTFLTPYQPNVLNEESVLDISHEALMRIWDRLRLWVDEEADSVHMYSRLSEASEMYQEGSAGLWRPPDLQLALNWREKQKPTALWAVQYNPAFERAMVYLESSDSEFKKEEQNKVKLQKRRLKVTRIFSLILGAASIISLGLFFYAKDAQSTAEAKQIEAEEQRLLAEENEKEASMQKLAALAAKDTADIERMKAEQATIAAEQQRLRAESQRKRAEASAEEARLQELAALAAKDTAEIERQKAEIATAEAEAANALAQERRMLSIAKSMAVKSLQIDSTDDRDLKALMAYQAYIYNLESGGEAHDADIYSGLYDARKVLIGYDYNVYKGHTQPVSSVEFLPGSDSFFSGGADGQVIHRSITDLNKGFDVFVNNEDQIIKAMSISREGKYLAVGTDFNGVYIYDITNSVAKPIHLDAHEGHIRALEFSDNSNELYSIGMDMKILKWSLSSKQSEVIAESVARYNDISLSNDGQILAACDKSGSIQLIDLENTGNAREIIVPAANAISALDFSEDGQYLAAGDKTGTVKIFDTSTWTQLHSLRGSSARIASVKFSSKGSYLASSSFDGSVLVWEMRDLKLSPLVMDDNKNYVLTVGFSPDEQYLISGSDILVIRPVKTEMLIDNFCGMIGRNFTAEEWELYVGADIEYKETCAFKSIEN